MIVFVHYTDAAFNTEQGRREVDKLAARNGRDLDGTALIKTLSELKQLEELGLVAQLTRPLNGERGPGYALCPVRGPARWCHCPRRVSELRPQAQRQSPTARIPQSIF